MNVRCTRCGGDNVRNARVIVDQDTRYTTIQVQGVVNGNAVQYPRNVTSQSERAQALTADEPKEGTGCWGLLLVVMLLAVPTLGILLSCTGIAYLANTDSQRTQLAIWLLASVLVFIALIVISTIVNRQQKNSFNRRHQNWYNMFDRRYYCGD